MRQLNIELLRIITMFLVLVVHASFFSLGWPTADVIRKAPLEQMFLTISESISIICVNVFILISGWFGINPKVKSLSKFLFQVFFFLVSIYVFMIAIGKASVTVHGVLECFTLTHWNWFIKAYLALFLLSPILNAFVELSNRRTFKWVLVSFFTLQTVYGCTGFAPYYSGGYSTISFIGLYLLARYLRVYKPQFTQYKQGYYIAGYIVCALSLTALTILPSLMQIPDSISNFIINRLYDYICPIVILESCTFFFIFEKLGTPSHFQRITNMLASSSFAAFLLHTNPNVILLYRQTVSFLYDITNNVFVNILCILGLIISVFILAILIDQIRIKVWECIVWPKIEHPMRRLISYIIG